MDLHIDFSGVCVSFRGLSPDLAQEVSRQWREFVGDRCERPLLDIEVVRSSFSAPPGPFRPKSMEALLTLEKGTFVMPEGVATLDHGGQARIELHAGLGEREFWTVHNLVRACLAWRLLDCEGALLHAAGIVVGGDAHLLVGPGGSGKSSWARLGQSRGHHVISDDVVLVEGRHGRLEALGSPFRSTLDGDYRPGRWKLAAIHFPRHGEPPRSDPVPQAIAEARVLGNMPFVSEAAEIDPRVFRVVRAIASRVPCRDLTFGLDPDFLRVLQGHP